MLLLTKFSGEQIWVNPDLIKMLETGGDTVVHFTNGERMLVRESVDSIREAFVAYKKDVYSGALAMARE